MYTFTFFLMISTLVNVILHSKHCLCEENDWIYHKSGGNANHLLPSTTMSTLSKSKECHFGGKVYSSGQRILIENQCIYCYCDEGKSTCFQQNCPPPPMGCELIDNSDSCKFSVYNCTIPEKHRMPLLRKEGQMYGQRRRGRGLVKADCVIRGIAYFIGETVGVASSHCLQCRCARATLLCLPLCCFEPLLGSGRAVSTPVYHRSLHPRDPHPLDHLN